MISADAVLRDRYGLHPRAAMRIQQTAASFAAKVTLESRDGAAAPIPAGTMIGLVSSGIRSGERVRISADGPDEADALAAVQSLLETGICHP